MSRRARLGIVIAAMVAIVLVLPVSAHAAAKYKTRFYGYTGFKTEYVVDRTVPGSEVATPVAKVKLQRYYNGAWRNTAGFIRVYRTTSDGTRTYLSHSGYYAAGAYVTVPLSVRGEYEFYYLAPKTTYNYSTRRYTARYDDIVSSIGTPTVTPVEDGVNTTFTVTQEVTWNSVDYPNLRGFLNSDVRYYTYNEMTDEEIASSYSWNRTILTPGTYTHIWNANTSDWKTLEDHIFSSYLMFENDEFIWSEDSFFDTYSPEDI